MLDGTTTIIVATRAASRVQDVDSRKLYDQNGVLVKLTLPRTITSVQRKVLTNVCCGLDSGAWCAICCST